MFSLLCGGLVTCFAFSVAPLTELLHRTVCNDNGMAVRDITIWIYFTMLVANIKKIFLENVAQVLSIPRNEFGLVAALSFVILTVFAGDGRAGRPQR